MRRQPISETFLRQNYVDIRCGWGMISPCKTASKIFATRSNNCLAQGASAPRCLALIILRWAVLRAASRRRWLRSVRSSAAFGRSSYWHRSWIGDGVMAFGWSGATPSVCAPRHVITAPARRWGIAPVVVQIATADVQTSLINLPGASAPGAFPTPSGRRGQVRRRPLGLGSWVTSNCTPERGAPGFFSE